LTPREGSSLLSEGAGGELQDCAAGWWGRGIALYSRIFQLSCSEIRLQVSLKVFSADCTKLVCLYNQYRISVVGGAVCFKRCG
jgi:hypothetical protein